MKIRFFSVISFLFFITFGLFGIENSSETVQDTIKAYYLDEVVITTSVKETNDLKNLPTAVSVITPRQLTNHRVESLPELSATIPNFFVPSYGSKVSTPIYIRGVGTRYGAQTVSLYVDNVPSFNPSAFDFEFMDIQRVEVLRGAQGTLYGRNSIGGVVNIYTLSPLTYQGTSAKLTMGNYGQKAASLSHYTKINDKFGISVAGYHKSDAGYFYNSYTGKKVDDSENVGGKIKLEWKPTDKLQFLLSSSYDYLDQGAFPYMHIDSTKSDFNEPSLYRRNLLTEGLTISYKGNGYTINSTTGYQYLKDDMRLDQDFTSRSVFSIRQQQTQHSVSQEVVIKSDNSKNYKWVYGLFGFYDNRKIDTPVKIKKDGVAAMDALFASVLPPIVQIVYSESEIGLPGVYKKPVSGAAFFHQSTLDNLFGVEPLSATIGVRFDYENTSIDYNTYSIGNNVIVSPPAHLMAAFPLKGDVTLEDKFSQDFFEILPKTTLKYQLKEHSYLYFSAAKSYKTGGYNEQSFSQILQNAMKAELMDQALFPLGDPSDETPIEEQLSYAPERSWTVELGGRGEFFSRRLATTFSVFNINVDNIQVVKFVDEGRAGRIIENAGKSNSKGAEISMRYNPTPRFVLFAEYGLAEAKFKKYETIVKGVEVDYSGKNVPFAPRHTLAVGSSYAFAFSQSSWIERLTFNAQYTGAGDIYWTEDNSEKQSFYGITNASVSIQKRAFGFEVWSKNIFDTKYNAFLFNVADMLGNNNIYVQRGIPMRFGATLKYTFN